MTNSTYEAKDMIFAVFEDGTKTMIQFWAVNGGKAEGFAILADGTMGNVQRAVGGFLRYEVA